MNLEISPFIAPLVDIFFSWMSPVVLTVVTCSRLRIQILGWSKSRLSLPGQTTADERQEIGWMKGITRDQT